MRMREHVYIVNRAVSRDVTRHVKLGGGHFGAHLRLKGRVLWLTSRVLR